MLCHAKVCEAHTDTRLRTALASHIHTRLSNPPLHSTCAGGDASTTPSSGAKEVAQGDGKTDEAAIEEAVDEELELEGLEDVIGDLDGKSSCGECMWLIAARLTLQETSVVMCVVI